MLSRIFGRRSSHISNGTHKSAALRYFLIIYDPGEQEIVEQQDFESRVDAEQAYAEAERIYRGSAIQVVLFSSDSLATVKRTHPHYFASKGEGDAALAALSH